MIFKEIFTNSKIQEIPQLANLFIALPLHNSQRSHIVIKAQAIDYPLDKSMKKVVTQKDPKHQKTKNMFYPPKENKSAKQIPTTIYLILQAGLKLKIMC